MQHLLFMAAISVGEILNAMNTQGLITNYDKMIISTISIKYSLPLLFYVQLYVSIFVPVFQFQNFFIKVIVIVKPSKEVNVILQKKTYEKM